jgi:tetratricopeptide (TPR) repeat protein
MGRDVGSHLTRPDFELLLSGSNAGDDGASHAVLSAHLNRCVTCRTRLELYTRQKEGWDFLRAAPEAPRSAVCPGEEKWLSLAAGVLEESESEALLDHATNCDACGRYLDQAVEDLNAVDVPAEAIPALSPEFGARVAAQLRLQFAQQHKESSTLVQSRPRFVLPAWAYIGAAAIAALIIFAILPRVLQPDPSRLLVQAYESGRTGVVRFPGATYTPQTGIARSEDARNAVLAEAEARILRALEKEPGDARWLRLRGQLDFLRRRYDSAIAILQPLTQSQDVAADLYMDLGMIYLARGLADANASDYENAIEYLSHGLQKEPNHPVGLFNRALALESMFLWDRAEQDWNQYLRIDSTTGWAREAKERLELVRQKKTRGASI